MKFVGQLVMSLLAGALLAGTASAGVVREDKGDSDWEILITPYLWGTSLQGTSQVGVLPPLDLDASFSDIVDKLNMALALHTEFHRGKWALVLDPMYVSLEADADVGPGATVDFTADIFLFEAWGAYKLTPNWEILGRAR